MRLLTLTNLYPDRTRPRHGIFVAERLRHLAADKRLSASVIALRPHASGFWSSEVLSEELASVEPASEIPVHYAPVPKMRGITNWVDPWLWARALEKTVERIVGEHGHDTILDAHFLYPDGAAAVLVGKRLGLPTVMTARGSDVNVKCENPVMRGWVRWAAANCAAVITVSRALAASLSDRGISAPVIEVLPNGVDLEKFRPLDRAACRDRLGVTERTLLSVGHLIPEKGHHLAIEALTDLPDTALLIVGDGPEKAALEKLALRRGVGPRVKFLGLVSYDRMPEVYNAADVLVLATLMEGMPNVVLESLASGTRVVATNVGGIPEILTTPAAGELMRDRSSRAIAESVERLASDEIGVAQTRSFAERFGWQGIVDRQVALYRSVLASSARAAGSAGTNDERTRQNC